MRSAAPSAIASLNNNSNPGSRPVIVTGPTGVGKTSFAVALARALDGEIIGADAFQVYAGLPILTAQPAAELLADVPHHLVGHLRLDESMDAARWLSEARACMGAIVARGRRPIFVGGTGMYLKALTHGLADLPRPDPALRAEIGALTLDSALARLAEADPGAPGQIDTKNPARVRRALEIVLSTGTSLAASRREWVGDRGEFSGFLLTRDREDLRERIAANVGALFANGVEEEIRLARQHAGPAVRRAIGFADVEALLDGQIDLVTARDRIVKATRDYAKRQLTWARNQFTFSSINLTVTPAPLDAALRHLSGQPA